MFIKLLLEKLSLKKLTDIIKRVTRKQWLVSFCVLVLTLTIIFQLVYLKIDSNKIVLQQTQNISTALTTLAAKQAATYIYKSNDPKLQSLVDDLSDDPTIKDASIYDHFGTVLVQSKNAIPLPKLLDIEPIEALIGSPDEITVIPYVVELYHKEKKIGYLRISLMQKEILSQLEQYQKSTMKTFYFLLLLSFCIGIAITYIYRKRVEKNFKDLKSEINKLIDQEIFDE